MVLYVKTSIRCASKNLWIYPFGPSGPPPYLMGYRPYNVSCADPNCLIYVDILDEAEVLQDSITITINGSNAYTSSAFVAPFNGGSSSINSITYGDDVGYRVIIDNTGSYSGTITVNVYATDNNGFVVEENWSFTVDGTPPYTADVYPENELVCGNTLIYYDILDACSGVKEDSLDAYVDGYWALRKGIFADSFNGDNSSITPISVGGHDGYEVCIDSVSNLDDTTITIDAYGTDGYDNLLSDTWEFSVDLNAPYGTDVFPLIKTCGDTQIRFKLLDECGIYEDMIDAYVDGALAIDDGVFQSGFSGSITGITEGDYDGYSIVITPDSALSSSTVKVDAYASDFCGNLLDDYNWSFEIDLTEPYGTDVFPLTKSCSDTQIRFKLLDDYGLFEDMIDAYVEGNLAIEDGIFQSGYTGSITPITEGDYDGYLITITPNSVLSSSTVKVDAYASDFCGNLLDDYNWSFSIDLSDPYGTNAFPTDGYSCGDTQIRFQILDDYGIHQDMIDAYVDGVLAIEDGVFQSGYSGSITPITDGYEIIINPDVALSSSTVKVDAYASDFCGNLLDDYNWSFSIDLVSPYGLDVFPITKTCGDTQIRFKLLDDYGIFEDMIDAYVDGALAIEDGVFQSGYSGSITPITDGGYDGYSIVITPDSALSSSTVIIDAYASDFCGNLLDDYSWQFEVDLSDPYGTNVFPLTKSCGDTQIVFQILDDYGIHEDMIDAYVEGNLAIEDGIFQSGYTGSITPITDGYEITITPDSVLSSSTVKVDAYAADFCGNFMDDYNWSFELDLTSPYGTDASPYTGYSCSDTSVYFKILDENGIYEDMIDAYVEGNLAIEDGVFQSGYTGVISPITEGDHDGYEITIIPDSSFSSSTVKVDAYASDLCGNLLDDYNWSFSIDLIKPSLDGYSPSSGATNQWSNTSITFNIKDIEVGVNQSSVDAYVNDVWVYDGLTNTFKSPYNTSSTITPISDGYELYLVNDNENFTGTVEIDAYASDNCNNQINPANWSFSIDAIDPYLDGYTPAAGSTAARSSLIVITMKDDETAVNPLSIDAYVEGNWAYKGETDTFIYPYNGGSSVLSAVEDGYQLTIQKVYDYVVSDIPVVIYFTDRGLNSVTDNWSWSTTAPVVTFYSPLNYSSIQNLDADITINGTKVSPSFRYVGGDATATTWNADGYGTNLGYTENGNNITPNNGSPCFGSDDDDSVLYNNGDYHSAAHPAGDIDEEDFYFEILINLRYVLGARGVASKGDYNWNVHAGWFFWQQVGNLRLRISDGSNPGYIVGNAGADEGGEWIFFSFFGDRDDVSIPYFNNKSGSQVDISSIGSLSNSGKTLKVGTGDGAANDFDGSIAYFAMYKQSNWFAGGSTNPTQWSAFHKERFSRLCGVYPTTSYGTAVPEVMTSSGGTLVHCKSGSSVKYVVYDNWARVCWIKDEAGNDAYGLLIEDGDTFYYKMDDGNWKDGYGTLEFNEITADQDRTTDGYMITLNDGGSASDSIRILQNDDNFSQIIGRTTSGNPIDITGDSDIVDGYEHTLRLIVKPDDSTLYVEDLEENDDSNCSIPRNQDRLYVGGDSNYFDGYISEIKIWDGYVSP